MEEIQHIKESVPSGAITRPQKQPQRFLGIVTLTLVFFASAELTVAYLSNINPTESIAQTAAAATAVDPFAGISLTAESAYVLDLTTNRTLYSLHPNVQLPLASLTKVPLALVVSEVLLPDTIVTIPPHETPDGGPVRLHAGLQLRIQDLLDFTLVSSSNEGAKLLSDAASAGLHRKYPEVDRGIVVIWRMNDLAKDLGLAHTYFLNSNGLDLSTTQASAYGSARDVARLFGFAASTSLSIFEQTSRDTLSIRGLKGETITASNTDEILSSVPGFIIGKTGYTDLAGGNLAIVFEVGPARPVVAVVLHSTAAGRFEDMKKLITATQALIAQKP